MEEMQRADDVNIVENSDRKSETEQKSALVKQYLFQQQNQNQGKKIRKINIFNFHH